MRLIDADKIPLYERYDGNGKAIWVALEKDIKNAPTVEIKEIKNTLGGVKPPRKEKHYGI